MIQNCIRTCATMKFLVLLSFCASVTSKLNSEDIFSTGLQWCNISEDVTKDFRHALDQFTAKTFKTVSPKALHHVVFSPLSAWINLASIAEAADTVTKRSMFQFLQLPQEPCKRLKYYQIATSRYVSSDDVCISYRRALVIDEGVAVNPIYHNFLLQNSLLDVVTSPMRSDPQGTLGEIRRVTDALLPKLDLTGNSVIIDAVDFSGLWSEAFEDAVVEKSPFYSQTGEEIGSVDLMKVKKLARMTHVQSTNVIALELPIGHNNRYRMAIGIIRDNNATRAVNAIEETIFDEFLNGLKESYEPIEIAIPRFNITSEFDVKKILEEDFEMNKLWTDPSATGYISKPAALPSGFVQRATITMDKAGLKPPTFASQTTKKTSTGLDPTDGQAFIANRPFIFGIFDAETYTCIMVASFTQPTYKNNCH